jgi:hypothetical protein
LADQAIGSAGRLISGLASSCARSCGQVRSEFERRKQDQARCFTRTAGAAEE